MITRLTSIALAAAAIAFAAALPAHAAPACSFDDVSGAGVTVTDCAGLYDGNLTAESGPLFDQAVSIIDTEFGIAVSSVLEKNSSGVSPTTFAIPLLGQTVISVHWGNAGTGFYLLDIAAPITQLTIANPLPQAERGGGLSSVALYTTTPVPEPETYALMLAGLGIVGFVARRRKTS